MPDLETQIVNWRRQMADGGVHSAEVLEELEGHLRDDIEGRVAGGVGAQEAFDSSVARLGRADLLKGEFDKVGGTGRRRISNALLTLAGISSYQSSTMNMTNSLSSNEPRWATYTKAAVFLAPAVCLWTFSVIFLMPKLQQVCQVAGVKLPWVYQVTSFIANNPVVITLVAILPFALLEWRWSRWPQFRRVSLGGVVFLLNAAVMVLMALMVIFALLAAPALMSKG